MHPVSTVHYDLCKQCGKRIRVDRSIRVDGCLVHGEKRDVSFSGYFCSPACLDTWVIGAAKSVGRPTGDYGSEPGDWAQ